MLQRWFVEDNLPENAYDYENDQKFIDWLEDQRTQENSLVNQNISSFQRNSIVDEIRHTLEVIYANFQKNYLF